MDRGTTTCLHPQHTNTESATLCLAPTERDRRAAKTVVVIVVVVVVLRDGLML